MRIPKASLVALTLLVAACSGPATQILDAPATPTLRVRPIVSSIEVRDVSLPRYAAADDVVVLGANGVVETLSNTVWADTPERSLTLTLARNLGEITGARVAAEPWPFSASPAVQVTVQVSRLLGQADGVLNFSGQYAIAPLASNVSDRSGTFDISVPVAGSGPDALSRAQGQAIGQLSETIARRLAR